MRKYEGKMMLAEGYCIYKGHFAQYETFSVCKQDAIDLWADSEESWMHAVADGCSCKHIKIIEI